MLRTKHCKSTQITMNAYAVSDNKRLVFDLTETRENLGYNPKDNAKNGKQLKL